EGGPKPLHYPVRRPDVAALNENPFTQNPGHPHEEKIRLSQTTNAESSNPALTPTTNTGT
ncbi:hypothetical protein ABH944_003826, partial [Caballeronia udeis]